MKVKTDSLRTELDDLKKAIEQSPTQFHGKPDRDHYCRMVLTNRDRDWGVSIHRY